MNELIKNNNNQQRKTTTTIVNVHAYNFFTRELTLFKITNFGYFRFYFDTVFINKLNVRGLMVRALDF